jgi:hypothetical protein
LRSFVSAGRRLADRKLKIGEIAGAGFFTMGETEEHHKRFNDERVSGIEQSDEVGVPSFAVGRFT